MCSVSVWQTSLFLFFFTHFHILNYSKNTDFSYKTQLVWSSKEHSESLPILKLFHAMWSQQCSQNSKMDVCVQCSSVPPSGHFIWNFKNYKTSFHEMVWSMCIWQKTFHDVESYCRNVWSLPVTVYCTKNTRNTNRILKNTCNIWKTCKALEGRAANTSPLDVAHKSTLNDTAIFKSKKHSYFKNEAFGQVRHFFLFSI